MRSWLIESSIYLVLGLGVVAMTWWQRGDTLEPAHLMLALAFVVGAAILIPARVQIAKIRRERKQARSEELDTFR